MVDEEPTVQRERAVHVQGRPWPRDEAQTSEKGSPGWGWRSQEGGVDSQWFSTRAVLSPWGHLPMSADVLVGTTEGQVFCSKCERGIFGKFWVKHVGWRSVFRGWDSAGRETVEVSHSEPWLRIGVTWTPPCTGSPQDQQKSGSLGVKPSIFYKSSPGDAIVLPELRASGLGELSGKNEYLCRNRVRRNVAASSWGEKGVAFELLVEEDLDTENWAQWREACSHWWGSRLTPEAWCGPPAQQCCRARAGAGLTLGSWASVWAFFSVKVPSVCCCCLDCSACLVPGLLPDFSLLTGSWLWFSADLPA